tara:strand:- start:119 stop:400 length:282 start_codon:yes stop_codon:yes gene_type:complete
MEVRKKSSLKYNTPYENPAKILGPLSKLRVFLHKPYIPITPAKIGPTIRIWHAAHEGKMKKIALYNIVKYPVAVRSVPAVGKGVQLDTGILLE